MRSVKLAMFLVMALAMGWTASTSLAGEASPASGQGGAASGPTTVPPSMAAPERIEGMVIGIARTSTTTTLTIRVNQPGNPKRDIRVELTSQTPIHQGIMPRNATDLTIASHVWMDCERRNGKLEADEIGILDPSVTVQ